MREKLAEKIEVSRNNVREAIQLIGILGLLKILRATERGTFVAILVL